MPKDLGIKRIFHSPHLHQREISCCDRQHIYIALIILGVVGIGVVGGVGVASFGASQSWWTISAPFSQMRQVSTIIMMASGGGGGFLLLVVGVIGLVRSYYESQKNKKKALGKLQKERELPRERDDEIKKTEKPQKLENGRKAYPELPGTKKLNPSPNSARDEQIVDGLREAQHDHEDNIEDNIAAKRSYEDRDKYGNKTANLQRLKSIFSGTENVLVPEFVGISHEQIASFVKHRSPHFETLVQTFKDQYLEKLPIQDALESIRNEIQKVFSDSNNCSLLEGPEIIELLQSGDRLMVRSTGREDSEELANPGGNESIANVNPADKASILAAIGKVVASYFSEKSIYQRLAAGDDLAQDPFMPILIQRMIGENRQADAVPVSGVMFTSEGELFTKGVVQVSATFGHAEGVVTGSDPSDTFYIHQGFIHRIIREKPRRKVPSKESGKLECKTNSKQNRKSASLTTPQLLRLAKIAAAIEQDYGCPMDVEWTYMPDEDCFYVFQARPILEKEAQQPSYIQLGKIKELSEVQKVEIVTSGGGNVRVVNKDTLLKARTAPEVLREFLTLPKDHTVQAVFISEPTAVNSHEAGFFRERGIPLVVVSNEIDLKDSACWLLDTQEEIVARLPNGARAADYIQPGLKGHLITKSESCPQTDFNSKEFINRLYALANGVHMNLDTVYGSNRIEKLLNAFDNADSVEKRAYLLLRTLKIVNNLLSKVPEDLRERLSDKILYNAQHVWTVYQDAHASEVSRKFAMHWLRTALLHRPLSDILDSETLYTALREIHENKIMNLDVPKSGTKEEYVNIFLKFSKTLLHPQDRTDWEAFVWGLSKKELQMLAALFAELGSDVAQIWANTVFYKQWANSDCKPKACMQRLLEQHRGEKIKKAIQSVKIYRATAKQFMDMAPRFANITEFDSLNQRLNSLLVKDIFACAQQLEESNDFEASILSHAFLELLESYDLCIKQLTSSPQYEENAALKAKRFAEMLEKYQKLALKMMGENMLKDEDLKSQAEKLIEFLPEHFKWLKKEMEKRPTKSLLPTKKFCVAMAALGSNYGNPSRAAPWSLEDLFTMLHQSMITAASAKETAHGISIQRLPGELCIPALKFQYKINLSSTPEVSKMMQLQRIQYAYPYIKIHYNLPLNNHSAHLCFEGRLDNKGMIKSLALQVQFFTPPGVLFGREHKLICYALSTYEKRMLPPPGYTMPEPHYEGVEFKWNLPVVETEKDDKSKQYLDQAIDHVQTMINYLQQDPFSPLVDWNQWPRQKIIKKHPWVLKHISDQWYKISRDVKISMVSSFLETISSNLDAKNIKCFLDNFETCFEFVDELPILRTLVDRLIDGDIIFNDFNLFKYNTHVFVYMNPDSAPYEHFKASKIKGQKPFTLERKEKIKNYINSLSDKKREKFIRSNEGMQIYLN